MEKETEATIGCTGLYRNDHVDLLMATPTVQIPPREPKSQALNSDTVFSRYSLNTQWNKQNGASLLPTLQETDPELRDRDSARSPEV